MDVRSISERIRTVSQPSREQAEGYLRDILDFQTSLLLIRNEDLSKQLDRLRPVSGSETEGRAILVLLMTPIQGVTKPKHFEDSVLPRVLQTTHQYVGELPTGEHNDLRDMLYSLETELYIYACMKYYQFNDDGAEEDDLVLSVTRFKDAVKRLMTPLRVHKKKLSELEHVRNLRVDDCLGLVQLSTKDFDEAFMELTQQYRERDLMEHFRLFVIELQAALYGPPKLAGFFSTPQSEAVPVQQEPVEIEEDAQVEIKLDAQVEIKQDDQVEIKQDAQVQDHTVQEPSEVPSTGQRKRARFTAEEDQALRKGVKKHGFGHWKDILSDPEFTDVFKSVKVRSAMALKDRWRNLV